MAEQREPARDWCDQGSSELEAACDALEVERLTSAHLRRELEQVRRLSSDLIIREKAARAAAEAANRSKDEFLATLSHEMRTPLNVVLGVVWRLRHRPINADAIPHALEVIDRNTQLQAQLVEDLLDLSRIITGKLRLHVLPIDIRAVVAESIDALRAAADAKGIAIDLNVDTASTRLEADRLRLQQVMWNLLSNAVRFTPGGGRITVRIQRAGDSLQVTVRDTGIGIAPDFLPYVFDRFRQGDSTSTRAHGGLGLGLSIVRHLVELHGGTVTAASEGEGRGAKFEVMLPIRGGEARIERRAGREVHLEVPMLDGLRVLVAEDKADTRTDLQAALEQYGATVIAVPTVTEAVEVLRETPPDVLLSDVHMVSQRVDVDPLLDALRAVESASGHVIPAVAVSAYVRSEDRVDAWLAGFKGYVSTPVNAQELAAIVSTLTRTPTDESSSQRLARSPSAPRPSTS